MTDNKIQNPDVFERIETENADIGYEILNGEFFFSTLEESHPHHWFPMTREEVVKLHEMLYRVLKAWPE